MLIDSHCHLDFAEFDRDRDAVMDRARRAGIDLFVTISIRVREFDRIRAVIEAHDDVYGSVGTLPHHADEECDVTTEELVEIASHPRVIAIGECGLDTFYGNASWPAQCEVFERHIAASRITRLPLIIHSVRQDEAMAETLRRETEKGAFPIVMHCFSGGRMLAETALALGAYISFSGLLSIPGNEGLREIAKMIPEDRLLVETDAPSLAPVPHLNERNEPAYIRHTVDLLAQLRGVSRTRIAEVTSANFRRLFTKIPA